MGEEGNAREVEELLDEIRGDQRLMGAWRDELQRTAWSRAEKLRRLSALISVSEIASRLGVARQTVYLAMRNRRPEETENVDDDRPAEAVLGWMAARRDSLPPQFREVLAPWVPAPRGD